MADLISEIVSQEAFEQVRKLTDDLNKLTETMDKAIATGAGNNKMIDANSMKAANDATANLTATTNKLIETESERLNIERQIKAEGEKMAATVKIESNAIEQAAAKYKMFANSQKELAQYIMETDRRLAEIKDELKRADSSASNYAEATGRLKIEQQKLKVELAEATKELKRTVTEQKFADDSMKGMSVRLTQLKDLYSQFTETERNSDFGMTISQGINELDEKLKGLDKSIGDNQRSVGNYEVAGKSLRMQLREIVQGLAEQKMKMDESKSAIVAQEKETNRLANTLGKNSREYIDSKAKLDLMKTGLQQATAAMSVMEKKGGEIKDAMDDANRSIKGMADDAGNTAAMSQGVGVLADSFQLAQAGMVAMGMGGEDMMKIYAKMMILQQGFNSLTQITNALQSESVLRLKLKAIWEKAALVFTQKKTAATVAETAAEATNAAATAGAAVATGGLATAEGVATTTSWTLVGSLKAVGLAIKSIPVIGWILAAVAALGTLTVLLYKHLAAEKELTAEQIQRKKLTEDLTTINQKVNESTLENVTRVKLLQRELGKVKQGSKEYQDVVKEINDLTGSQFNTIKATPAEIAKGTAAWINQYKIRAKAEATIQKIVQNELEFQQLSLDIQNSKADDRKELIDKLPLLQNQKDMLLSQLNLGKETTKGTQENATAWKNVMYYINLARGNMEGNNAELEKGITLEGLMTDEKKKQVKEDEKIKSYQTDILKLKAELYLSGEELLKENTRIELAISEKKYQEEIKQLREKNQSIEELQRFHQLEIDKIQRDGFAKVQELRQKNFEDIVNYNIKEEEERNKANDKFKDDARNAQDAALEGVNKYMEEQEEILQKQIDLNKERISSVYELIDSFSSLGSAIAGNIKDEKKRIIVEQRIAEVQIALSHAIAIAQILIDKGDPYTKVIRIAANLAAVAAGFVQAEAAISQANSVQAYAEGTDYHKGGAAIVGEGGQPELVSVGSRQTWITEPTFIPNLPIGASVTPLDDMKQDQQSNYWLEKLYNKQGSQMNIDVSGRILPTLIKDGRVIRFANKIITARG